MFLMIYGKNNVKLEEGIELSAESLERLLLKKERKDENTHNVKIF
jgi:hypothetical protein